MEKLKLGQWNKLKATWKVDFGMYLEGGPSSTSSSTTIRLRQSWLRLRRLNRPSTKNTATTIILPVRNLFSKTAHLKVSSLPTSIRK